MAWDRGVIEFLESVIVFSFIYDRMSSNKIFSFQKEKKESSFCLDAILNVTHHLQFGATSKRVGCISALNSSYRFLQKLYELRVRH